jgi:hypothetical protein
MILNDNARDNGWVEQKSAASLSKEDKRAIEL